MIKEKKVFGTTEWAAYNANFINGCVHNCKYCYSKAMAIRFKRKTVKNWNVEKINLKQLERSYSKKDGTVMYPSSHDISPKNLTYSLQFLDKILSKGNDVLIVTKPHLSVIKEICDRYSSYKSNILFRFSIGSSNSETLKFWEPSAPSFEERFEALQYAYNNGYKTSVSGEPLLDTNTDNLVEVLLPYVTDAIWLGKPNLLLARLKVNGYNDKKTIDIAERLINEQTDIWVNCLYDTYKNNSKIKWKESIKKIIGIEISTQKGVDK